MYVFSTVLNGHSARPGDGQLETSGDSLEDDSGLLLRELAMFLSKIYRSLHFSRDISHSKALTSPSITCITKFLALRFVARIFLPPLQTPKNH